MGNGGGSRGGGGGFSQTFVIADWIGGVNNFTITITHNQSSQKLMAQVLDSTGRLVFLDRIRHDTVNTSVLTIADLPDTRFDGTVVLTRVS